MLPRPSALYVCSLPPSYRTHLRPPALQYQRIGIPYRTSNPACSPDQAKSGRKRSSHRPLTKVMTSTSLQPAIDSLNPKPQITYLAMLFILDRWLDVQVAGHRIEAVRDSREATRSQGERNTLNFHLIRLHLQACNCGRY